MTHILYKKNMFSGNNYITPGNKKKILFKKRIRPI